jgi:hypothetical protein
MWYDDHNPVNVFSESTPLPWKSSDRVFAIKVHRYCSSCQFYAVSFTNNGFLTSKSFLRYSILFKDTDPLLETFPDAVKFAQKFQSYEQCEYWNLIQKMKEDSSRMMYNKSLTIKPTP